MDPPPTTISPPGGAARLPASGPVNPSVLRGVGGGAVPTEHDLKQAREDSLLQLRIGRSSHYYTMILFVLFLADGYAILLLNPYASGRPLLASLYVLLPPVAGALLVALFGLWVKWEAYQLWPWEAHFWLTVLAVPAAAFGAFLIGAGLAGWGPTASWPLVPGELPLLLGASSLALTGLTLTWGEWTRRKLSALAASLLPFPLALELFLPGSAGSPTALTLTLMAGGGLYLVAGSILHLISSGTQAHE
ncbi:MAG: hypothetical protein ACREC5_02745, partial [Thermoplasmata archaeon]